MIRTYIAIRLMISWFGFDFRGAWYVAGICLEMRELNRQIGARFVNGWLEVPGDEAGGSRDAD